MRCQRILPAVMLAGVALPATAQTTGNTPAVPVTAQAASSSGSSVLPDWLAIHGQATFVLQGTPGFSAPFSGAHSLKPYQAQETADATLILGVRPWGGGEFWVNPEIDQGFGLSNTLGIAGFPSAEAYKVGQKNPYLRLQRAFFRQTIDLGGASQDVDGDANQFAGITTANRLVLTVGKFAVGDVFDTNKYAHDPRGNFLNWTAVDTGTFDYAADAWGYTTGIAGEWYQGPWTLRLGLFNTSKVPNGTTLTTAFQQYQLDGEIERRYSIAGRNGAVRVTVFSTHSRLGTYDDAIALAKATDSTPDTALVRKFRTRMGVSANLEQAITDSIGFFVRAGLANGQVEPFEFTDIDRTVSAGFSIDGKDWGRAGDSIGIDAIVNGISGAHERYLADGGLGLLVGDGKLPHPGDEAIGELYYMWVPAKPFSVTLDYQLIGNPAYNRDRGPVNVLGLRLHGQF